MYWIYYPEIAAARFLVFFLSRFKISGKENIPKQGPVLVVSNHLNLSDPIILGAMLGRRVQFMAKEELFRSKIGAFFVLRFGAYPIHRGKLDIGAMRQSKRLLSQGYVLVMFPEGKRSTTACLETAYSGSALIARRTGVPILPVGISGTEKLKGRAWLLSRPEVTMNIGQPFSLPEVNGRLNKEDLVECTEIIMRRIAELLPPEYRGEYGADK